MSELDIPNLSALGVEGTATGAGALALYWTIGPSIKAIGNVFGEWTDYRLRNLLSMSEKIDARRSGNLPVDGGHVHPRVATELIAAASWIDDDLHQEYLAGLFLDARRTGGQKDDGKYYSQIITQLTSSQVRLHYGIYGAYAGTYGESNAHVNFNHSADAIRDLCIVAPRESFASLLDIPAIEGSDAFPIAVHGLIQAGLITECAGLAGPRVGTHLVAIPTLLGAIVYHKAMSYTSIGIDTIRLDRDQLARINPDRTFADLTNAPKLRDSELASA